MNLISWIFLALALVAGAVAFLMSLRAQKAAIDSSQAQAKAEADTKTQREQLLVEAKREAQRLLERGTQDAESMRKEAELKAKEQAIQARQEAEKLLTERQNNLEKQEQRIQSKEQGLQAKEEGLDKKVLQVDQKAKDLETLTEKRKAELEKLETQQAEAKQLVLTQAQRLEEIAGLTREDAKKELISQLEYSAKMDAAKTVRRIEEEAQEEGMKKARWTIGAAIQRVASDVVVEQSVSSVQLPSDDLKGRIIGREGRNIRSFEQVTGVNVVIDDTPDSVLLSCFDPVRREVGRRTLSALVADGRSHPLRIEELYERSKAEVEAGMQRAGEDALVEAGLTDVHPDLVTLLGRLRYRTSYGQNVLAHLVETAHIASHMASELGVDPSLVKRGAFFHDVGKALTHEVEGSHAALGADLARRYGEREEVVHAIAAHHGEVAPETVEAVLTQASDSCSGGRPGARRDSLEAYVKRLDRIEEIASSKRGVERVFAMQAGREVRVMVQPDEIDDLEALVLAREVAQQIQDELTYPGQIRVTVVRESRATEIAH